MNDQIKPEQPNEAYISPSELNAGLGLLPCAHCGGTAAFHQQKTNNGEEGGFFIECGNPLCWVSTPLKFAVMDDVKPLLAEIWNLRTVMPNV